MKFSDDWEQRHGEWYRDRWKITHQQLPVAGPRYYLWNGPRLSRSFDTLEAAKAHADAPEDGTGQKIADADAGEDANHVCGGQENSGRAVSLVSEHQNPEPAAAGSGGEAD